MVAGFIVVRHRGRRVHTGSLDCKGCTLVGVVGFVRRRSFHWGAPWGSSGSCEFIGVRPWGGRVHPGSLGSVGRTLGVVWCRWVHWGAPWGS